MDLFEYLTARHHRAMTDTQRARALGVSRSTLARMRQASREPSMVTATRIARRLETTVDALFPLRDAS